MTAILFLLLVGVGLWRLGLSGMLRWTGVAGVALGLGVVLGIDAGQGLPLLGAGILVWLIGRSVESVPARPYRL
jgi:hypothetical protein